jgi:hypothetical protein
MRRFIYRNNIIVTDETIEEYRFDGLVIHPRITRWVASVDCPMIVQDGAFSRSGENISLSRTGVTMELALVLLAQALAAADVGIRD